MTPVFRHGRLRLYLLRLLDEEPRHGYEVIRLLRDRFMGVYAPSPGTIYPRLARLEEEGLVTHDEENGRKVYRITEAGRAELRSRGAELDELEAELSASVSDIVREVREDVRDTVRSLREELTRAAREMRRTESGTPSSTASGSAKGAGASAVKDAAREAREAADAAREQAKQAREAAWAQAKQVREQAREQAKQARDEAFGRAQRLREDAASLRDTGGWGEWGNWGEWSRWTERSGRPGWPGAHDMAALRDFERLARDFVTDLRSVAWDSSTLVGTEVLPTLRNILEDTLYRIRTEVFGINSTPTGETPSAPPTPAAPSDSSAPSDAPTPAAPAGSPAPEADA